MVRQDNRLPVKITVLQYVTSCSLLGRSVLSCSSKAGLLWKQTHISSALISISFQVPSKIALPPGSPYRASSERERERYSKSRAPFIHLTKSLVNETPSRFPSWSQKERDACLQNYVYIIFRLPGKRTPLPVPLN